MIEPEENPEFVNDFLAYSLTILNKSENSVKEYNYDIAHFLKFIKLSCSISILTLSINFVKNLRL